MRRLSDNGMTALLTLSLIAGLSPSAMASLEGKLIATVTVGSQPMGLVVTPDNTEVYVANSVSNTVTVISAGTNSVMATIPVGNAPAFVAITPDGSTAFVSNNKDNTVSQISTSTKMVTATFSVGKAPLGVAVSPNGQLYVCNAGNGRNDGTVSVIDTSTLETIKTIPITVGRSPLQVVLNGEGTRAYILNEGDLRKNHVSTVQGYVTKIETEKNTIIAEMTFAQDNSAPLGIGVCVHRPEELWVSCLEAEGAAIRLVHDHAERVQIGKPNPEEYLGGLVITPDGDHMFVANTGDNKVTRIRIDRTGLFFVWSRSVHLGKGNQPVYLAISPNETHLYTSNSSAGTVSVIETDL
jgi:YVTN family beta-propeller protein